MTRTEDTLDVTGLIWFVQSRCGTDLSRYRPSCIRRRVLHRLSMLGLPSVDEYMGYLQDHPDEIEELLNVVTIHVTGFFRDEDVFDALSNRIFPALIEQKLAARSGTVRIWSAGCSTGEETYSVVIALLHAIELRTVDLRVEIFGTDISEEACRIARRGQYPSEKVIAVPRHMLRTYFTAVEGDQYRISPDVRRRVKFNVHDLFSDPPFSLLDMIVCRNVLIHFEQEIRVDVLRNFHAALGDNGLIVLGKSEAMSGPALGLFDLFDPRCKIYRKRLFCGLTREE